MATIHANAIVNAPNAELQKQYALAVTAKSLKIAKGSLNDKNTAKLATLLNVSADKLGQFLSDGKKKGVGADVAKVMGCADIYAKLEKLADEYDAIASKHEDFKSNGYGDLVLYVRGK